MPIRRFIVSATAVIGLASFAGACGEDHRTEDFCAALCSCEDDSSCTDQCTTQLTLVDEQTETLLISDECFVCVSTTTCERIETACSADCSDLTDALNQQPPSPVPEPDPRPGDQ